MRHWSLRGPIVLAILALLYLAYAPLRAEHARASTARVSHLPPAPQTAPAGSGDEAVRGTPQVGAKRRQTEAASTSAPAHKRPDPALIPPRFQGRLIRRRAVRLHQKIVALTFDDGPCPDITPHILHALAQYKAHATFFVMGEWAQAYPDLIRQEVAAGDVVGSHSYSHPLQVNWYHSTIELNRTAHIIEHLAGYQPTLFRPPWGNYRGTMAKVAAHDKCAVILWTVCGNDNLVWPIEDIVSSATRFVKPGDIVLLHDGHDRESTVRALPEILRRLHARGYSFVTVPQLLWAWDRAMSGRLAEHHNALTTRSKKG